MKVKLQIITKLDDSSFQFLRGTPGDKATMLHDNLWSMFDIEGATRKYQRTAEYIIQVLTTNDTKLSIDNFGWTKEVSEAFYKHPKHRHFTNRYSKDLVYWKLNSEPSRVYKDGSLDYTM